MNEVNILLDILKQMVQVYPGSAFVNSLYQQYCNQGGLSKKQMEGLYSKACKTTSIPQNKLATLEAIIKTKPTRERAAASIKADLPVKDGAIGEMLTSILAKYPQHKRVLFFSSKYENNEAITVAEMEEIKKFYAFLLRK
jgi:ssDNA-specific exonuclease RecJ